MLQAILLDRDGVINRERADYVKCWDEMEILPGALAALRRLARLPIPICVVTNQSAIGRKIISAQTVDALHRRLAALAAAQGGRIDAFFVCPHHPDAGCDCRKPKPGLLLQAAQRFSLDLSRCILVGDSFTDYAAAAAVHCPAILVQTGRQGSDLRRQLQGSPAIPLVSDLNAAAEKIRLRYDRTQQTV
ncbi:MAG: HAD-IIIA family hydrolase [Caldilineaceae bacterium]|nr:HAD-IIIA family hydrolase [Caldilineaceae bacterium]